MFRKTPAEIIGKLCSKLSSEQKTEIINHLFMLLQHGLGTANNASFLQNILVVLVNFKLQISEQQVLANLPNLLAIYNQYYLYVYPGIIGVPELVVNIVSTSLIRLKCPLESDLQQKLKDTLYKSRKFADKEFCEQVTELVNTILPNKDEEIAPELFKP
ncbi:MAG: hypothetical protein KAT71_05290 [Gammaproteobacteria bacterium]|nr:hypothetical protein [Gammaproteobacteria bacterium]